MDEMDAEALRTLSKGEKWERVQHAPSALLSARSAPLRPCRAVTLVLVLIAVAIAATLALTFASAQSTSVGIASNVQDYTKARYVAESGLELTLAYVRANSDWRTTKSNGVWVSNQSFGPGTFTASGEDGIDTNGDDIPDGDGNLSDDANDLVTLTVTGRVGGTAHIARAALTRSPTDMRLVVYGVTGNNQPLYREWTGSTWSGQQSASDTGGEPRWIIAARHPTTAEVAACVLDVTEDVGLQVYDGSSWSAVTELTAATVQVSERCVDLAYEQSSGDLLIAYRSSGSDVLRYRTRAGGTLSSESTLTLAVTAGLKWIQLAPKPGSNEILLVTMDTNKDVCAAVWSGSAWSNGILLENDAKAASDEGIAAAYETQSGTGLVAWAPNGVNTIQYRTWSGSAWSAEANGPTMGTKEPRWLRLVPDPSSNKVLLGSLDSNKDVYVATWSSSAWGAATQFESSSPDADSREFDIAFEKGGTNAIAAWGRNGSSNFYYRIWNGSTWSAELAGPGLGDKVKFTQLVTGPATGQVLLTILNKAAAGTLEAFLWNGTSMSALGSLGTNIAGSNAQECYMVTRQPIGSSSGGAVEYAVEWRE